MSDNITSIRPSGSASTITGNMVGWMDLSSLYPSTMIRHLGRKRIIKAKRILKNIKHDIE